MKPKECWNCKGVNFRWFHHSEFYNMLIHQCKKCLKEYFIPSNEPMYSETTTYMYDHIDGEIRDINGKVKRLRDVLLRTDKEYQLIMSKRSPPTGKWVGSFRHLQYPQKKKKRVKKK